MYVLTWSACSITQRCGLCCRGWREWAVTKFHAVTTQWSKVWMSKLVWVISVQRAATVSC